MRQSTPEFARERRRYRRWSLAVPIHELKPETHVFRATNIGAGGLYCPDAVPRAAGETILLEIELGSGKVFVAKAHVVSDDERRGGLRVQFAVPQDQLEATLRRLNVP